MTDDRARCPKCHRPYSRAMRIFDSATFTLSTGDMGRVEHDDGSTCEAPWAQLQRLFTSHAKRHKSKLNP